MSVAERNRTLLNATDSALQDAPRQRRFARNDAAPRTQITARDLAAIRLVARFRFLSSEQLARLLDGSEQQLLRRLRQLYDHQYLDRPTAQLAQLYERGNLPMVYGLAKEGARLLAEHDRALVDHLDWHTKNRRARSLFIAHTIETADVVINFALAVRGSDIRLIDHHDLIPTLPPTTRDLSNPLCVRITAYVDTESKPVNIAVIPDRVFSLVRQDGAQQNFCLELDRGTMDIENRSLTHKSSLRRKFIGYWHAWLQHEHTEKWGFGNMRALFVTTSDERVANMIASQKRVTNGGSGLFLFTTRERLASASPFDANVWLNGKGESVRLLA